MKKQCKRKVYRLVNPIDCAIMGARLIDDKSLKQLRAREFSSLESMVSGTGTRRDWQDLVDCMNLCQMMAMNGIGPEALECCTIAEQELLKAAHRYEKTMKMGLSGVGITAMRDVIEYAQLQQSSISRSVFEEMIDKTINHIRSRSKEVTVIK